MMMRSNVDQGRLRLTADLQQRETRSAGSIAKPGDGTFGSLLQRFPPIEEVVASLDRIASRTLAA